MTPTPVKTPMTAARFDMNEFEPLLPSGRFNLAAGFSTTVVIVTTSRPLVEVRVVVMLSGTLELALELTLTGSGAGCVLWVEVVVVL